MRQHINEAKQAIAELKSTVKSIATAQIILDTMACFMIALFVFVLTTIKWYWAAVPAVIYSLIHVPSVLKAAKLRNIEKQVPMLEEQLRTAADNTNKDSQIVEDLCEDVVKMVRQVTTGEFIKFGKISTRLITLIVLSFLIIFASATDVRLVNAKELMQKTKQIAFQYYEINQSMLSFVENETEEIYGNRSLAELGYEQMKMQITPIESDIDVGKTSESRPEAGRAMTSVSEQITPEEAYQENIPKDYQKIVKEYFNQITTT